MPLFKLQEDYRPHPRRWWHIPLLLLLVVGTIIIAREYSGSVPNTSWKSAETQKDEGTVFGTFYHLTYHSPRNLQASIDSVLTTVDLSLSPFNPKSVISAIDENRSVWTDTQFRHVFQLAA